MHPLLPDTSPENMVEVLNTRAIPDLATGWPRWIAILSFCGSDWVVLNCMQTYTHFSTPPHPPLQTHCLYSFASRQQLCVDLISSLSCPPPQSSMPSLLRRARARARRTTVRCRSFKLANIYNANIQHFISNYHISFQFKKREIMTWCSWLMGPRLSPSWSDPHHYLGGSYEGFLDS